MHSDYPKAIKDHLIYSIQHYVSLYPSHLHVLKHMLLGYGTGYEWIEGGLTYLTFCEKERPPISQKRAKEIYKHGNQRTFCNYSNYSVNYSPLFNIPDDVTEDWLHVIKDFVYQINNLTARDYQIQLFAHYVQCHGINNPNTYVWYDRNWKDFQKLREYTNQLCKDRGWETISVDSLHDPEKKKKCSKEMNEMLTKILDEADGFVPAAKKALKKQDAEDYVRRYGVDIFKEVIAEMENPLTIL